VSIRRLSYIADGDVSNVAEITLCNHIGTHIDAPLHFDAGGLSITDFDVNEFHFRHSILADVPLLDGEMLAVEHLVPFEQQARDSDLLLIRTGFGRYRATCPERYGLCGPGFSAAAAEYIVRELPRLRCLGVDTVSLASMQALNEGLEAHRVLLGGGRRFLIIEDMNLDALPRAPSEVLALPLLVHGLDGVPCTVVARSEADVAKAGEDKVRDTGGTA